MWTRVGFCYTIGAVRFAPSGWVRVSPGPSHHDTYSRTTVVQVVTRSVMIVTVTGIGTVTRTRS
jgi:hypothetical protein